MNNTLKKVSIIVSILIILVACVDFFVLNEYQTEGSFFLGIITLMLVNIVRHFSERIQKMFWLLVILYISILCMAITSFSILLIFSFGYGYTGREAPWNHIFAIILDIILMIVTIVEFSREGKRNR